MNEILIGLGSWLVPLEWAGSALGISGAWLMAARKTSARYAWTLWIGSNLCLILFALGHQHMGLLFQQLAYLAANILGIRMWRNTGGQTST